MKNVHMAVEGNILTIKVDLSKEFGPSSSPMGRSGIVAVPNTSHAVAEGTERWFCYVLECADGTFYTGITTSIDRRLAMHKRGVPHDTPAADFRFDWSTLLHTETGRQRVAARSK